VGRIVDPGIADDAEIFVPPKLIRSTMGTSEAQQSNEQAARNPVTLGIAAFAANLGGYFAVQPFFDVPLLIHPGASILVFLFGAPLVLGLYGHSLGESAVTGLLVPAGTGVRLSDPAFPPIQWISGALILAGYTLPVAVLMFIIGAALRRDGTVRDNYRRIAFAVIVSLLVVVLIAAGGSANIIPSPGGDQ
jgi:hypothetical protein